MVLVEDIAHRSLDTCVIQVSELAQDQFVDRRPDFVANKRLNQLKANNKD